MKQTYARKENVEEKGNNKDQASITNSLKSKTEAIKAGLLGLGTVGTGVYRIIEQHQEDLKHQTGCDIKVEKILIKSMDKERSVAISPELLTTDYGDILNDPNITIVIEVMGGIEEARTYIAKALQSKKNVITANKDLIALYGGELLTLASENGCDLFYEASVAGGIPILRALVEGFASDRITKMIGILNGTTNYMLTRMAKEKLEYDFCLKQAQELGYAEADPTSDVEGLDAARKLAILGTLGFHTDISLDEVKVKGISSVSQEDIQYGKELGYEMKLLGIADRRDEEIELSVQPTFVAKSHPLAHVNGVFNAVYVYGEAVGETMFYGPGAGELPTATAVVSDLVTVVKNLNLGVNGRGMVAPYREKKLKPENRIYRRYFIRLVVKDRSGMLADVTKAFADHNMSISKMIQKPLAGQQAELVTITHTISLKDLEAWVKNIESNRSEIKIVSYYAVEGEEN
ncbi:homoserine dehydrogenase [Bacillus horti]|uniref:Homoserine dehydrogenase n=1 Tax=Caldalkalibacillus horti TaxID=77523 RepID=A0ABT9VUG1_9BACI|nr:homoserine dehydrogenase [Bacillus horti]MDQ0164265.1 homoserine dehydrogenase [Bacillus horti]